MDWRAKTLVGILLIVLGLIVALFEAGLLVFMDCSVECPEGRQRVFVMALVVAGLALAGGGVYLVRRARRERLWKK